MRDSKLTVRYLLFDAFGIGGTVRAVITVANYLAAQGHDVEIASVFQWRRTSAFEVDPRVRMVSLTGAGRYSGVLQSWRAGVRWAARHLTHSGIVHPDDVAFNSYSKWSDAKLLRYLREIRSGVLITTRPSLNLLASRYVDRNVIRIGQEHTGYRFHPERLQSAIADTYGRLDAVVTLTEADHNVYSSLLAGDTVVATIPNAITPAAGPAPKENTVVAAGRLIPEKGFDLLVRSFALVSARYPDWSLKIFGSGPEEAQIRHTIETLGQTGRARLMGSSTEIGKEFAKASVCAVSSRSECFPMVILEGMAAGLPVVSFNCPGGPKEMIRHDWDGLLVKAEDVGAFAEALDALMVSPETRERLGLRAVETSRRFSVEVVGQQWLDLMRGLQQARAGRGAAVAAS